MEKFTAAAILVLSIAFAISPTFTAPFSGFTPDQLPNPQIDPPIQPEGYAFAIWGLIYTWLIVSAVLGLWKRADAGDWHAARLPLAISLAVGVPWLAIANASAIWATITIIIMALGRNHRAHPRALRGSLVVPSAGRDLCRLADRGELGFHRNNGSWIWGYYGIIRLGVCGHLGRII